MRRGDMNLGISSFSYGWAVGAAVRAGAHRAAITELLGKADDFGVGILQIGDNIPMELFSKEELAAIRREASSSGIALEIGARGLTVSHLQRYVGIAVAVGASMLRFVVDKDTYEPSVAEAVDILRRGSREFEAAGVTVAIENHDRLPVRELARLVDGVGSVNVGICLDTANSLGAGEGIGRVLEVLSPLTVNVHIKDYSIKRQAPHHMGFTVDGTPAGRGMLNIPRLIETVSAYGRNPSMILEVWTPPEAEFDSTVRKEALWVMESVSYLQGLV